MRLLLMRHAKAASADGLPDHDRPLTARGERDAHTMGRWLRAHQPGLGLVWCSSARRARETWAAAAAELAEQPEPSYLRSVYQAAPGDLLDLLRDLPPTTDSVLVVGHNPTMQQVLGALTGEDRDFPTGALAVIDVAGTWAEPQPCALLQLASPRDH